MRLPNQPGEGAEWSAELVAGYAAERVGARARTTLGDHRLGSGFWGGSDR